MIKAEWITDYDYRNDKCYKAVGHKECYAPIFEFNGIYKCVCCGKEARLNLAQRIWYERRKGTKIKTEKCFGCGKRTMKVMYRRNHMTRKWECGNGECNDCGIKFIV